MANPDFYQGALTGNLITIKFAGRAIGLIRSMQVQEDFGLQPVSGIGMVAPIENVPSMSRINISCESVYISLNAAAQNGGSGSGLTTFGPTKKPDRLETTARFNDLDNSKGVARIIPGRVNDILKGTTFTIEVAKINGEKIRVYEGCSYGGGSISFQAHQIIVQNATFMALDYYDEFTSTT